MKDQTVERRHPQFIQKEKWKKSPCIESIKSLKSNRIRQKMRAHRRSHVNRSKAFPGHEHLANKIPPIRD